MESSNSDFETRAFPATRTVFRAILRLLVPLFLAVGVTPASADQWSLLLNGKAIHLENPPGTNYNEKNWGVGLEYDFALKDSKWRPFLTSSSFKDSNKNPSHYAGGGVMRRYAFGEKKDSIHFDIGLVAFAMIRKDIKNGNPFLGALPVISLGTDRVALNVTYIPRVDPKYIPLVFLQVKVGIF